MHKLTHLPIQNFHFSYNMRTHRMALKMSTFCSPSLTPAAPFGSTRQKAAIPVSLLWATPSSLSACRALGGLTWPQLKRVSRPRFTASKGYIWQTLSASNIITGHTATLNIWQIFQLHFVPIPLEPILWPSIAPTARSFPDHFHTLPPKILLSCPRRKMSHSR